MLRKLLASSVIAVLLVLMLVPVVAFADDDDDASGVTPITDPASLPATCSKDEFKELTDDLEAVNAYCTGKNRDQICQTLLAAVAEIEEDADTSEQPIKDFLQEVSLAKGECGGQDELIKQNAENSKDLHAKTIQSAEQNGDNPCAGLDGTTAICSELKEPTDAQKKDKRYTELYELRQAIQSGRLLTILEEPIGDENVFIRARQCLSEFVRDSQGNLQSIDTRFDFDDDLTGKYAIQVADCREFLVYSCKPTRGNISHINITKAGDSYEMDLGDGKPLKHLPVMTYCDRIQVIYGDNGVDLLKNYVGLMYRWAAGFVGVIAVVVIMISGIQISTAGDDSGRMEEAKNRIIQSLVAIALLFLSGIILYAVNPTFFTSEDIQKSQALIEKQAELFDDCMSQNNNDRETCEEFVRKSTPNL